MDGHTTRPTNAGDRRGCGLGFILAVLGEQLNKQPAKRVWKELGGCRDLFGNSALAPPISPESHLISTSSSLLGNARIVFGVVRS